MRRVLNAALLSIMLALLSPSSTDRPGTPSSLRSEPGLFSGAIPTQPIPYASNLAMLSSSTDRSGHGDFVQGRVTGLRSRKAVVDEIASVPGMTRRTAEALKERL